MSHQTVFGRRGILVLVVAMLAPLTAGVPAASAPIAELSETWYGTDTNGQLGRAIASDGVHHIIGATNSALAVQRVGSWGPTTPLVVPGGNPSSFGSNVALDISADGQYGIAAVGAPLDSAVALRAGSAHVFEYSPVGGWTLVESIAGSLAEERVGSNVAVQILDDDRTANVLVGAENGGRVGYVTSWIRQNGTSSALEIVTATIGGDVDDRFGQSLAVDGDTMVVGSPFDIDGGSNKLRAGSATVFSGDPAGAIAGGATMGWVEQANLSLCGVAPVGEPHTACGTSTGEYFGFSVAIDGDVIAAGAWLRSAAGGGDAGSVGAFRRTGLTWDYEANLYHTDAQPTDRLGTRVAVQDRLIMATAVGQNAFSGALQPFVFDGKDWVNTEAIVAEGPGTEAGWLGLGLSLDGTSLVAGAPLQDTIVESTVIVDAGAVFALDVEVPPPDYPPVTQPDSYTTWPSDATTFDVLANDVDPEGNALTLIGVRNGPNHGTVNFVGGTEINYTPASGFTGVDTFEYQVSDGRRDVWETINVTVDSEVRIEDVSVDESVSSAEVSVVIDPPSDLGVTFTATYADGTATTPDDYTPGLAVFAVDPGAAGTTVSVPIVGDNIVESTETFTVSIADVIGAHLVDADATVTIFDEDVAAPVSATIRQVGGATGGVEVNEPDGTVDFEIVLSEALDVVTSVDFATREQLGGPISAATVGDDFTDASGTATFQPGDTVVQFGVPIADNGFFEDREGFEIVLTAASPVDRLSLAPPSVLVVTIIDDEDNVLPPGPDEGEQPAAPAPPDYDPRPSVQSVCQTLIGGIESLDPTAWFSGLDLDALPALPDVGSDFPDLFDAIRLDLPDCAGFTSWDDFVNWLKSLLPPENPPSTPAAESAAPFARPDEVTMRQGTTVFVDVMANDHDPAARQLSAAMTGSLPTGLTAVDVDPSGLATVTAAADFVGTAQFLYELCPVDASCATGSVFVTVIDGPVPPLPFPDHVTLDNSEILTYSDATFKVAEWGPNVLLNDTGPTLELRSVTSAPFIDVSHRADGQVRLEHIDQPGFEIDGPPEDIELVYEVCTSENACATSTLTVHYMGEFGPATEPDFANANRLGTLLVRPLFNDPDNSGEVVVTEAFAAPESVGSTLLIDVRPDNTIEITMAQNPDPVTHVLHKVCPIVEGATDLGHCTTELITIYLVDRIGPVAQDDNFRLPIAAAWRPVAAGVGDPIGLDVIGEGGGGADEFWGRHGSITEPALNEATLVYAESLTGERKPFAIVINIDNVLVLTPPSNEVFDLPGPDWNVEFEYDICDYDIDTDTGTVAEGLCDTGSVYIDLTAEASAEIATERYVVGVWPTDDPNTWAIPFGYVPVTPSAQVATLETGSINYVFELRAAVAPEFGYVTGSPSDTSDVDIRFYPSNPQPTQQVEIHQEVDNPYNSGAVTSKVYFARNELRALPAVVEVPSEGVVVDLADFAVPSPYPEAPVTVTMLSGQEANGAEIEESFYRVTGTTTENPTTIRIDANSGIGGIARALPYTICADFEAPRGEVGAELLQQTRCRDAFLMLRFDTTSDSTFGNGLRTPGTYAQFPFDTTTDTYVEFRLDEELPDVRLDDTTSLGPIGGLVGGLDDLLRTNGITLSGAAALSGSWSALVGVDPDGLYIGGESLLTLELVGVGVGSFEPGPDDPNVTVSATAAGLATITIKLGNDGERLRLTDLAAGPDLQIDYDGIVGVLAQASVGDVVTAQPYAITTFSNSSTGISFDSATVDVPVQITLPGVADDNGDPVVIEMRGTVDAGQLIVTGAADLPPGSVIDGFGLRDVNVDLTVTGAPTDTTVNGTISAMIEVEPLGISVPIDIMIDGANVTATALYDLAGSSLGPVDAPFLTIDEGTLTVVVAGNAATNSASVSVGFLAETLRVLPDNPAGSATLTGVNGSFTTDGGAQTLSFESLTAGTDTFTAISTGTGTLTLGDSSLPLLALNNVTALDTGGVSVTIVRLEFYDDGRVLVLDGCLAADAGLAAAIGIAGILPFDVTSACVNGNEITVNGHFDFTSMEDLPFTPSISIGGRLVNQFSDPTLETNQFVFTFDATTLEPIDLGPITVGVADLEAVGVTATGSFTIAGYSGGDFDGTFAGEVDIDAATTSDGLPLGGALDAAIDGEITFDLNGTATFSLNAAIGATGFIGDYVELTSGDLELVAAITVTTDLAIDVTGPGLTSADLVGIVRVPGLESSEDATSPERGGIPVTISYDTTGDGWELTATAGGGGTYTAGGQTFTDVTGELRITRATEDVVANGVLTATSLQGSIADLVDYSTGDAKLTFDGSLATPLLAVNNITATLPDLDDPTGPPIATLTIDFIEISDDGALSSGVITATELDRLADRFGFGDLFPFSVTGLQIDPTDLADLRATVAGEFNFSDVEAALAPATFSATIGDTGNSCDDLGITGGIDTFCFTIAVEALTGGGITPIDFGPVDIKVSNLDVAGVVGNADFRIEGYQGGTFDGNFSGSVDVATDFDGALDADFSAPFVGQVGDDGAGGVTMQIVATVDGSASVGGVSGSVTATFELTIAVDADGNLTVTGPRIESAAVVICLELPGFASTSVEHGECDGVFASIVVDGDIWTATLISDVELGTSTNGLTIDGLTGSLTVDASDPVNLAVSGQLGADRVAGVLGGLIEVEVDGSAGPITFNFDTDPETKLLDSIDATGRLLGNDGTTLATLFVNGFSIAGDGTIDIDEIGLTDLDALANELGVADILPFGVSGIAVEIVGDDLTQPESFVIRAAGTFDLSAISQYDPIVQIGDVTSPSGVTGDCDGLEADAGDVPAYGGTFCFALNIDENGIRPYDLGPITLGLRRVEMGPITMAGELTIGGYQDGAFVPTLDGYLEVTGETTLHDVAVGATGRVDISAAFGADGDAVILDLTALLTASLQVSDLLIVEDATVGFGLGLRWDPESGLSITGAEVNSVGASAVQASAGGIVTMRMTNVEFPLDGVTFVRFGPPEDFDPAVHGDGEAGVASLTFGALGEAGIDGWGGSVRNFEIGMDGGIDMLPSFGITATGASAKSLGLDEWIPISVTEAGIVFNDKTPGELLGDLARKRLDPDDLTDVTLIVSAELTGTESFPVQGAVEGLEVNVRYLREWTEALLADQPPDFTRFPVTNLDAVFFGVSNVELGPITFSGGLGFGVVDTDQGPKFWGRVLVGGTYDGFGLSIDMTVTERGPISLKIEVPAAIVLGQTTIVLAVQEIAVAFNKEIPSICTTFEAGQFVCTAEDPDGGVSLDDEGANGPLALVNDPAFGTAHLDTVADIRHAVETQFVLNDDGSVPPFDALASILPEQFALSVKGSITSIALAGQLSGNVEVLISFDKPTDELPLPGVRIIGTGTLNVYGMGVGEVKIYLDYSDPLAPAITLAAALPAEGGLLDLLVPGTVQFGITVDSQGMYAAPILAMRELIVRTLQSTANNPEVQEIIEPLIADLADRLEANRDSELAMIILDVDRNGVIQDLPDGVTEEVPITVAYLTQRVAALLPNTEVADDGSQGDSELLFGRTRDDLILASEFATALFMDLLNGSADLSQIDLPEGTTFDDVLAAMVSVFQDVLTQAPDIAQVFYDVINPSIIMQGLVQYELFDIPLGEPAQEALIVIDKNEVWAEFTQSLKATSQMAMVVCTPCLAVSAALTAGLDDRTTMRFSLPFPIQELIDGEGIGALDPFSGGWSMTIGSELYVFGFNAGTVDGIIAPADSSEQITTWLETLPEDRAAELSVPDSLAADGGVYASGRLQLPELLADPLGWITDAQAAYDGLDDVELLQLPTYLSENAETLLATREVGSFEMFVPLPTPQALSDAGIDFTDGVTPDELEGTALDLLDDLYVRADLGLDLFGYRMTTADFSLTEEGMEGSITFPFFGDPLGDPPTGQLTALVNNTTYTVENEVTGVTEQVTWPAVKVDEEVSIETVREFLEPYGFDTYIPDGVDSDVRFRAYSPGYHLSQPDPDAYAQANPLSVNGGIELVVTSDIAGVLEGGALVVSVGFGVNGSLLPSSIDAVLSFSELNLGGVTITDASLTLEYRGDGTNGSSDITVTGTIEVLDTTFQISGSLSSGRLEATSEQPISIAGLTATDLSDPRRGPVVAVLYDDATDTAAIEVKGRLYVPGWDGYATINALLGSGADAVTASLVGLRRGGVYLGGTMSLATRPTGFTLTAANATVTVPGLLGPVTVDAVITEQGVQSMSVNNLAFQFAPGIGFECADIDFTLKGEEFRLNGSANITIVGLAEVADPKAGGRTDPVPVGCQSKEISATFDLATSGYGSFGLQVDDVTLGPVTVSDVDVSVTRNFRGVFANLDGTVTILGSLLTVDGSMAITSGGLRGDIALSGAVPDLYGWQMSGRIGLDAEPGRATRFSVDGRVTPPGTAGVDIEGWVDAAGNFSLNVTSPGITFGSGNGALTVSGSMTLNRSKSKMSLRLTDGSMTIASIGTVSVDELLVNSTGTFSVTNLSLPQFGNSNLKLLGAQIDAKRTGTGAITITLRGGGVTGRFLNGQTVSLGTNNMTATLDPNMFFERDLTVTNGLDLGPALQTSRIKFTFRIGADGLDLTQRSDVNVSTLAGSATMTIKDFDLHVGRTGGSTIGGRLRGKLTIAGRTLSTGNYSISNSGSALRLSLDTTETIKLGALGTYSLGNSSSRPAWFKSDGTFNFTLYMSFGAVGLPRAYGELTIGRNSSGLYTDFDGTGCGYFPTGPFSAEYDCASAVGTLSTTNVLKLTVTHPDYGSITLWLPPI